jgi:hypothetical protein
LRDLLLDVATVVVPKLPRPERVEGDIELPGGVAGPRGQGS